MGLDDARTRARRVRDRLDGSHDRANVELLDRHIAALDDPRRVDKALAELARMCQVRRLGDTYHPTVDWTSWLRELAGLQRASETELRRRARE